MTTQPINFPEIIGNMRDRLFSLENSKQPYLANWIKILPTFTHGGNSGNFSTKLFYVNAGGVFSFGDKIRYVIDDGGEKEYTAYIIDVGVDSSNGLEFIKIANTGVVTPARPPILSADVTNNRIKVFEYSKLSTPTGFVYDSSMGAPVQYYINGTGSPVTAQIQYYIAGSIVTCRLDSIGFNSGVDWGAVLIKVPIIPETVANVFSALKDPHGRQFVRVLSGGVYRSANVSFNFASVGSSPEPFFIIELESPPAPAGNFAIYGLGVYSIDLGYLSL